ncbi:MAG: hypothetical protein A2677_00610 [Candidatus Komeilibacteria bacterium RIFCSPHIGHO2_01_FULL_52_14]|uniref:Uncharacterized protein n=1 Tax=Candidatus Komeilibacteria bacterium RIFCSPHIGHO2_01_FULL_52_14 TaxID=1798549 RepID=A0A1G2BM27_9BACT|nr:MAG: hypothetical protein A2677_00610 [Candidatus Komeilibacteria bacterium RIFCSPHIGHO2_01_FULL_52_14]
MIGRSRPGDGFVIYLGEPPNTDVIASRRLFGVLMRIVISPRELAGYFLIPNMELGRRRMHNLEPGSELVMGWMVVPDVYAAFRQTEHTLRGYGIRLNKGEKHLLRKAADLAVQLNLRALGCSTGPSAARLRWQLKRLIDKILEPLYYARDISQKQARKQLEAMMAEQNPGGSLNLPAIRARSVKARTLLDSRIHEIMTIEPKILARQRVLLTLIELAKLRLEAAKHFIDRLLAHSELQPVLTDENRAGIADQCGFLAKELSDLDFEPYTKMCQLSAHDLRLAQHTLRLPHLNSMRIHYLRRSLWRCQTAITIKNEQIGLERIILGLSRTEVLDDRRRAGLENDVRRFIWRLARINDADLTQPVIKNALHRLDEAIKLIAGNPEKGSRDQIKEALKSASREL